MQKLSILSLFFLIPFIISCDTSVHRVDPDNVENEVNTNWDAKDIKIFARKMVESLKNHRLANTGAKIRVTKIRNKSHDHQADTKKISTEIQEALIEMGCYRVLTDASDMADDQEERDYSDLGYGETGSKRSQEEYSDYILRGELTDIVKQGDGVTDKYFHIFLELSNYKTGEKVWLKNEDLRKQQTQSWFGS